MHHNNITCRLGAVQWTLLGEWSCLMDLLVSPEMHRRKLATDEIPGIK